MGNVHINCQVSPITMFAQSALQDWSLTTHDLKVAIFFETVSAGAPKAHSLILGGNL